MNGIEGIVVGRVRSEGMVVGMVAGMVGSEMDDMGVESGETATFVLPMLTYISRLPPMSVENEDEGPYAVVMAPTRELAQQIEDETIKFAHYLGIKVVSIVGGQSIEE
ncbi:hypothetical protein IFM89_013653 [Coptis chinensis]|uniref:DEAD/DEAH-box helicase domain-containing protein n=1 Tax=Coptis chinensis TaxID=261450 RepID=A0A835IQU2_9MAGN|nr:hypothetical protein IFM89_013653 [Coptis chinensis]